MTSKISFFKLLKSDLKRSIGFISIISLVFFLYLIVGGATSLEHGIQAINQGYSNKADISLTIIDMVEMSNEFLLLISIAGAVLCGVFRFRFLHAQESLDLYHSLAIKRERIFAVQYISGILQFILPYIIMLSGYLILVCTKGLMTTAVFTSASLGMLYHLLFFLLNYTMVILGMILTGKILVGIMAAGVLSFYFAVVALLIGGFSEVFLRTYYMGMEKWQRMMIYVSPIMLQFAGIDDGENKMKYIIAAVVLWVALLMMSVVLYRKRPSEAAGNSIAFRKMEAPLKFCLVVPLAWGTAFVAREFIGLDSYFWFWMGLLFGIVLFSAIIEFIYHLDFGKIFSRKRLIGISFGVAAIVVIIFQFDVFGYDNYKPEKGTLESAAIHAEPFMPYCSYAEGSYEETVNPREFALENMQLTSFESLERMVEAGNQNSNEGGYETIVKYRLKNGKEVMRSYGVPQEVLYKEYTELMNTQEFKEGIFPILSGTAEEITEVNLMINAGDSGEVLNLKKDQRMELLGAYKRDVRRLTARDLSENKNLVSVGFTRVYDSGKTTQEYPILDAYKETIALLKEYGFEPVKYAEADKVTNIWIYDGAGTEHSFSEKQDIEEIMKSVESSVTNRFPMDHMGSGTYQINVTLIDEDYENGYGITAYLEEEALPDCVKEKFGIK